MRNIFKTLFYFFGFIVGKVVFLFYKKNNCVVILMYHSFDNTNWKYGVKPRDLERQIKHIIKHRKIVPLQDVVSFVKGKSKLENNSVAITVDDGYEDTYSVLFPLARRYNFPFTVFLTSDLSIRKKLGELKRPTWNQLKEMVDSSLVSVEVHGRTHVNWTGIKDNKEKLYKEILGCRNDIKNNIGVSSKIAAYPAGRRSDRLECYLKNNHFEASVAITEGVVFKDDNLYALKRVQVDKTMNYPLFVLRLDCDTLKITSVIKKMFYEK